MNGISFQTTEDDLAAAFRLHHLHSMKSWRVARSFLLVSAVVGVAVGAFAGEGDSLSGLKAGLGGFCLAMLLLGLLLFSNHLHMSRKARRIFAQQKNLRWPTHMEWDAARISFRSERGFSDLPWDDFMACIGNQDVILLLHSEAMMNFIPRRALSAEQAAEILAYGGRRVRQSILRSVTP